MIALRLRLACRHLAHWSRAIWLALLVCVLVSAPTAASRPAARPDQPGAAVFRLAGEPPAFAPGEVLIGWEPGQGPVSAPPEALRNSTGRPIRSRPLTRADAGWQAAAAALNAQTGSQVLDVQPAFGYARLAAPAGRERAEMARLARLPWVRYAEPNYLVHAAAAVDPNDPYYSQQWNLPRVFAPQAWNITMGLNLVTVAVLDSGVDFGHPDLASRLRSDGTNFITPGTPPQDDSGHGTHVAGIIAADTNNGIGVAGVAGKVMILPYKILAPDGHGGLTGTAEAMATAIYTAVSANAQVINISAGGTGDSSTVHTAVSNARLADVLVVAAAGNDGNAGNPYFYPAAYPEALAVAATDANDAHPAYSGHQPYVALSAPGGTSTNPIVSTYWPGSYAYMYGTSMATPMVSGAAALILSANPTISVDDLIYALEHTADKVSSGVYPYTGGRNDYFGYGRLNAWRGVQPLRASAQRLALTAACTTLLTGGTALQNVLDQPVNWTVDSAPGQNWLTVTPTSGTLPAGGATILTMRAFTDTIALGSYNGLVRVRLTNAPHTVLDINVSLTYLPTAHYCLNVPVVIR